MADNNRRQDESHVGENQEGYIGVMVSNISSHFQERLEMGFDSENKWEGRGRGGQAPIKLTDGVFKFFPFQPMWFGN